MNIVVSHHPIMVLVFGMEGCPACESFLPIFQRVRQRHPQVPAYAIDCNEQPKAADKYKVTATPTTIVLRWGYVVRRREGQLSERETEQLFQFALTGEG